MPTLLVVDDAPIDRKMACELLREQDDLKVLEADGGASAIEVLNAEEIDLVVTDLLMAPMNGLGLIQHMLAEHPGIPVIIMTSLGNDILAVKALKAGAASYVAKRRLAMDLTETVRQVLTLRAAKLTTLCPKSFITRSVTSYELGNDVDQIQALIGHLQDSVNRDDFAVGRDRMASISFSEAERLRLNMALYEAMLNGMRHGNLEIDPDLDTEAAMEVAQVRRDEPPYKFRNLRVEVTLTAEEAVYVVRDEGKGFNASEHLFDENDSLEGRPGRGIALMQTIMDEVRYNTRGNEVTLTKRR